MALAPTRIAWAQGKPAKPAQAASAKPDIAAAKKHYAEGEKKYAAGDHAGALTEFEAANDIKPAPQTERYLGMCEDNLGHFVAAADWYEKFLAHVPEKMAAQGEEMKKRQADIRARPGRARFDAHPSAA